MGKMKGREAKMARMEDILSIPVQDPPFADFSSAHITWVKVEGGRLGGDDIALIPLSRVDELVKGESSNAECPANFRVESRRKRAAGSFNKPRVDGYLEYTLCLEVQREMFNQLRESEVVEEFVQVFIDQSAFTEYFRRKWLPNIGKSPKDKGPFFLHG